MSNLGIQLVTRVSARFRDQFDHQSTGLHRHGRVALAVKSPYWYIADFDRVTHIAATANGYGSGKHFRMSDQTVPGSEASHGQSGDVDAMRVDRILILNLD
jgi:hypothetical protein